MPQHPGYHPRDLPGPHAGLRFSEAKTRVVRMSEGLSFPLRADAHGGFGERSRETDRKQSQHRAQGLLIQP